MTKLSATAIKNAASSDKNYKMSDGSGLYLLVTTKGGRYWRYDFRFAGKRKTLALGTYPSLSLKAARELHFKARQALADGIDPSAYKQIKKIEYLGEAKNTFAAVADEWRERHLLDKSESYRVRSNRILEKDLLPTLGPRPIRELGAVEVLSVLRAVEVRTVDIAHRAKQLLGLIFRYAIATGRADRDPTVDLYGALKSRKVTHHAALSSPSEVGEFLRAIQAYQGRPIVKAAIELSVLVFQRPGEIRHLMWEEINWAGNRWEIPSKKMKMDRDHIVPLSKQAQKILHEIEPLTGRSIYVFPNERSRNRAMSDNGVRSALRTLGYSNDQMTPHGFRATARTLLDEELGFPPAWIEQQLAHRVSDPLGRAYNRTAFLEDRSRMMQVWADYLDRLRDGSELAIPNLTRLSDASKGGSL